MFIALAEQEVAAWTVGHAVAAKAFEMNDDPRPDKKLFCSIPALDATLPLFSVELAAPLADETAISDPVPSLDWALPQPERIRSALAPATVPSTATQLNLDFKVSIQFLQNIASPN